MRAADAPTDHSQPDPRIARCRRVVDTLTEAGLGMVHDLESGATRVRDPSVAFCRIARALRMVLLLDLRLDALAVEIGLGEAVFDRDAKDEGLRDAPERPDAPERTEAAEDLRDRREREAPDEVLRYLKRPLTELVGAICRDVDLSPEATAQALAPFADLGDEDDTGAQRATRADPVPRPPTPTPKGRQPAHPGRALGP